MCPAWIPPGITAWFYLKNQIATDQWDTLQNSDPLGNNKLNLFDYFPPTVGQTLSLSENNHDYE